MCAFFLSILEHFIAVCLYTWVRKHSPLLYLKFLHSENPSQLHSFIFIFISMSVVLVQACLLSCVGYLTILQILALECWLGLPGCVISSESSLLETQIPHLKNRSNNVDIRIFFLLASDEVTYQASFVSCGGLYQCYLLYSLNSFNFLEVHLLFWLCFYKVHAASVVRREWEHAWKWGVRRACWVR